MTVMNPDLIGKRWNATDAMNWFGPIRREDFTRVVANHRDELESSGALLHWAKGKGDSFHFRATAMAQWMEDNMAVIESEATER